MQFAKWKTTIEIETSKGLLSRPILVFQLSIPQKPIIASESSFTEHLGQVNSISVLPGESSSS